jgi:hypothetical protein
LVSIPKSISAGLEPWLEFNPNALPWIVFTLFHNVGIVAIWVEHDAGESKGPNELFFAYTEPAWQSKWTQLVEGGWTMTF